MGVPSTPPPSRSTLWRHLYAGTAMAVTILAFVAAGLWADKKWGLSPWGVVAGTVVGFGIGLFNLIREFANE